MKYRENLHVISQFLSVNSGEFGFDINSSKEFLNILMSTFVVTPLFQSSLYKMFD